MDQDSQDLPSLLREEAQLARAGARQVEPGLYEAAADRIDQLTAALGMFPAQVACPTCDGRGDFPEQAGPHTTGAEIECVRCRGNATVDANSLSVAEWFALEPMQRQTLEMLI